MIICQCGPVGDATIRAVIEGGARTVDDVGDACGAGIQCGTCRPVIERMIEDAAAGATYHRVPQHTGPGGQRSGNQHG